MSILVPESKRATLASAFVVALLVLPAARAQTIHGGEVNISGATLFRDFFAAPASTNDFIDVDGDGFVDHCDLAVARGQSALAGDSNCDGLVNSFDIDPFVLALTNPAAWEATYSCNYFCANDVNRDGAVNSFDIDPFVQVLTGGGR